jgi:hypothetical protein
MINESDCSRDFSKEMTKKYRDTHKKIRNCNEFDNSLNFAKVSVLHLGVIARSICNTENRL